MGVTVTSAALEERTPLIGVVLSLLSTLLNLRSLGNASRLGLCSDCV